MMKYPRNGDGENDAAADDNDEDDCPMI